MNIVLIRSNPVKPYPRLEKMALCLLKRGYGVTVLAWDRELDYSPRQEKLIIGEHCCNIIRVGLKGEFTGGYKKNLRSLILFQRFIYKWLTNHRSEYDVIHAYDFDTGFTARKVAKKLNKVFVYDIADYYADAHGFYGAKRKIVSSFENKVISKSFATLICTEERKNQIRGAEPKRLYVIHNTPEFSKLRPASYSKDKLRIAYIGIFSSRRFIQELLQVVSTRNDCELHIGGFGPTALTKQIEMMSIQYNNINYYGRVPYAQTLQIEKQCDILSVIYDPTVPNHVYAAPNKFYEALALGKPMIMAKGTGMSTILEEYNLGETIDYNIESLEKAIDRLIERKSEWPEIGKREQELYESRYSWAKMEKRIHKLYDEVEQTLKG